VLLGTSLSKTFANQKIVDDVSVALQPGQICVLIGPSGSGKTTLLKMLALLEPADSGVVEVDSVRYEYPENGKPLAPPWPKVTAVFQQLFLWPHLTLKQNIILPMSLRFGEEKAQMDRVEELINLFDMKGFIDRFPNQVSGGQRQRAALARAILLEPKYLLLDEITSALDVEQIAIILDTLKELASRGIGVLSITHLLHFAKKAADSVIFMDGGKIIESGTNEILLYPKQERMQRFISVIESAT